MRRVSRMLHASIKHALDNRADAVEYAKQFGRGLDDARIDRFVGMYVNELTLDYGDRGRAAVRRFLGDAWDLKLIPKQIDVEFVE